MAEEKPSFHVDTDWKKQAQEEKRRLAEEEKSRASASGATTGGAAAASTGEPSRAPSGATAAPSARELPPASFAGIVSSLVAQALFYLGDLAPRGGEPVVNLDLAKQHIDTLAILEEKTKGNLTEEEKRLLDSALYEVRMRYVTVASRFIN